MGVSNQSDRESAYHDLLEQTAFVRRLARRVAGPDHEDVAQETMLAGLRARPRDARKWRGWLAAVVRNQTRMAHRRRTRRTARERSSGARRDKTAPSTDDVVAKLELHRQLVVEALALREPYRSTIIARYFEDLTPTQIAAREKCPRKTVATRLHRALAMLRERLDQRHGQRALWAPALLAWTQDAARTATTAGGAAIKQGAIAMASKVTIAAGGFVLGAVTTFTVTEVMRGDEERATPRRTQRAGANFAQRPAAPDPAIASPDGERATTTKPASQTPQTPQARSKPPLTANTLLRRINAAQTQQELGTIWGELWALDHKASRELLFGIYDEIERPDRRHYFVSRFAGLTAYTFQLEMAHRVIRDGDFETKNRVRAQLMRYALLNFRDNPELYPEWERRMRGLPRAVVMQRSAQEFADRLKSPDPDQLIQTLHAFERPMPSVVKLKDKDLVAALLKFTERPTPRDEWRRTGRVRKAQQLAWRWLRGLQDPKTLDQNMLRRWVKRLGDPTAGDNAHQATETAIAAKSPWLFEELLIHLRNPKAEEFTIGSAFGDLKDKRAIPYLIAEIAANSEHIYGYGYFGLGRLTGVRYDKSHDGEWWLRWWDTNKAELPPHVQALDPRKLR